MPEFEYRIMTNGYSYRVQWRGRGGWFFGLWRWPWVWLTREINCGMAGTEYEPIDFTTFEDAAVALNEACADNVRHKEREQWREVVWASPAMTGAVDPPCGR